MSYDPHEQAAALIRHLEAALALYEEQRQELQRELTARDHDHAQAMLELTARAEAPLAKADPDDGERSAARLESNRQRLDLRHAAQKSWSLWLEEALSDADLALLRLPPDPVLNPHKEAIHAAISRARQTRAQGAPDLRTVMRERMHPMLTTERTYAWQKLAKIRALEEPLTEQQGTASIREGMLRSVEFFGHWHDAGKEHEMLVQQWRDRQEAALQEALEHARTLRRRMDAL